MDRQERLLKFRDSKQAAVKLQLALEGFSQECPCPEDYLTYLLMRIRPAMESCILKEDTRLLDRMADLGWMDGLGLDDLIRTASDHRKNAALIWLLRRKQDTSGFCRPDFTL